LRARGVRAGPSRASRVMMKSSSAARPACR
jgi:hypothetical protein